MLKMYSPYHTYCVYDVSIRKAAHKYIITNELYNLPTDILYYIMAQLLVYPPRK